MQTLDIRGCKRVNTLPTSLLDLDDKSLVLFDPAPLRGNYGHVRPFMPHLKVALRRHIAVHSLLCDRDARQQSLENLSIVAVLLATAAFLAFSQAPEIPSIFLEAGLDAVRAVEPFSPVDWLRRFFTAVSLAFVLAMAVVVFITIMSIPQVGIIVRA